MLRLYDCATAPSPRRTRILLAEKEVEYECIQVDLRNNEQLGDAYKAINPRCSVPYIETPEGLGISENVAIASYLEDTFPAPPMLGETPYEKAKIFEWNARIEFDAFMSVQEVLRNKSPKLFNRALPGKHNIPQIPALIERGRARLGYFYSDLNEQLSQSEFVAGDSFSFADITAIVAIDFAEWIKLPPGPEHSHIAKWHDKARARASYAA